MLTVLSMMRERGSTLSEILAQYPRYCILKGQLPLNPRRIPAMFSQLERNYADGHVNSIDGLRVDWPGRWMHVRVSQTEPIVRVICEQRDEPPRGLFDELMEQVRQYA
jgi:phosphomannomutase